MSVLYESKYGVIISHEKFIENVYENTKNARIVNEVSEKCKNNMISLRYKQGLFDINVPYDYNLSNNKKNKKLIKSSSSSSCIVNNEFSDLNEDVEYVINNYKELRKEYFVDVNSEKNDNKCALELADEIYKATRDFCISNANGQSGDEAELREIQNGNFVFPKNARFFCKDVCDIKLHLNEHKFDLIVMDPPWWNKYIRRKKRKSDDGYQMMNNQDLAKLPINDLICEDKGLLVVWCTNSKQHIKSLCEEIFPEWGLNVVGVWFWLKITKRGEPICKFSQPPGKQPFERIIFGCRKPIESFPKKKLIVSIPSALHSHKPPLLDLLSSLGYNVRQGSELRCLEIFARSLLPNWTSYGLEALLFQHESLFE